jgi:hypothetical protein
LDSIALLLHNLELFDRNAMSDCLGNIHHKRRGVEENGVAYPHPGLVELKTDFSVNLINS